MTTYPYYTNGLWKPIPHRGLFSQPRHMGEGLDPAPNVMTDFKDPHGRPQPPWGADRGWDRGLVGAGDERRERELKLTCKTSLFLI